MANLPSSFSYINDVEFRQDNPVAEFGLVKLGSNDNYLRDGLDAEIATRASEDSAIRGAGPYDDMTATKARIENARRHYLSTGGITAVVGRIQNMSGLGPDDERRWVHPSIDRGFYAIEVHFQEGTGGNIARAVLVSLPFLPVSNSTFMTFGWNSTFANMFAVMNVYKVDSV